jgi:hypothetical protein
MELNEGVVSEDSKIQVKNEMIRQLRTMGAADPDAWERAVFEAMTGHTREDVDWDVEDNQAGYHLWIKSFDGLIEELVDDGYVREERGEGDARVLRPTSSEPDLQMSQVVYPGPEAGG